MIWIESENMATTFGIAKDSLDELELPDFIEVGWAAAGVGDPERTLVRSEWAESHCWVSEPQRVSYLGTACQLKRDSDDPRADDSKWRKT